ncbi:MAG: hypothetical protein UY21_C0009G0089 [Microgenomates group bacterium GW2011_GWA1_48_10]|nr:MAG: hypothetical protein UY21_C0009G0089 [Microgenomates group bacterium GW2011_GWA1_48_10]
MATDLNFLPEKDVQSHEDKRQVRLLVLGTGVFTILALLLTGGLFVYATALAGERGALEVRQREDSAKLAQHQDLMADLFTLKQKIKGYETIEKKRFDFSEGFDFSLRLVPPGISLTQVGIEDSGKMTFVGESESEGAVAGFLRDLAAEERLDRPTLRSLQRGDEGDYQLAIDAIYDPAERK